MAQDPASNTGTVGPGGSGLAQSRFAAAKIFFPRRHLALALGKLPLKYPGLGDALLNFGRLGVSLQVRRHGLRRRRERVQSQRKASAAALLASRVIAQFPRQ
jgi:hypothetical protein